MSTDQDGGNGFKFSIKMTNIGSDQREASEIAFPAVLLAACVAK